MDEIRLDKGVPVPPAKAGRYAKSKYPFDRMEVGDSFVFRTADRCKSGTADGYMRAASKRYGGKFTQRKVVEDGVAVIRIWRTA